MTDAWDDIKALKSKRNNLREKLEKRKKERHGILHATGATNLAASSKTADNNVGVVKEPTLVRKSGNGIYTKCCHCQTIHFYIKFAFRI